METYFAKQPILNAANNTFGYELLYRHSPEPTGYMGTDGNASTASVLNSVFFGGEPSEILGGGKAFVNFTEKLLVDRVAELLPKDIVVVEVLETVEANERVIGEVRRLKELGYTIALDDYVYTMENAPLFPFADIVKIDFKVTKAEIENTAAKCRAERKIILAEKVENAEEVAYAKSIGCTLMQGYFFAKPLVVTQNTQSPMFQTFLEIVRLIECKEPDIDKIDAAISRDSAMALKLLRVVNAVRNDTSEKITSVKHAIVMLGLAKIREWVYLCGLQNMSKDSPAEFMRTTLFRAYLCEEISKFMKSSSVQQKEMYLMGLMSLVTGDENDEAINKLPVSDNIKQGLKHDGGVFTDVFECVTAHESSDWDKIDAFCGKYKLTEDELSAAYLNADKNAENSLKLTMGRK